jgi:hypothetical protein
MVETSSVRPGGNGIKCKCKAANATTALSPPHVKATTPIPNVTWSRSFLQVVRRCDLAQSSSEIRLKHRHHISSQTIPREPCRRASTESPSLCLIHRNRPVSEFSRLAEERMTWFTTTVPSRKISETGDVHLSENRK